VDTWDQHEPWDPPKYYVEHYYPKYEGRIVKPCYGYWRKRGLTEEDLKIAYASYCGETSMVDRWIGFLLNSVEALNLMDNTTIIFATDHGFYFGEHRIFGKMVKSRSVGRNSRITYGTSWDRSPLYEEVSHIPLIIYSPIFKPREVDALVSLPDLMPTILELADADIPESAQAKSLVPLLSSKGRENWDYVVTAHPLKQAGETTRVVDDRERTAASNQPSTITSKDWSLIYSIAGEPAELYHLPSDPNQEDNILDANRDVAADLIQDYVSMLKDSNVSGHLIDQRLKL
jgi:arylsulfatase A-like enzyme